MKDGVNERNLIEALRRAFPELEARYETEVGFWNGERTPSNYDFVGFVFKPEFRQELEKGTVTDFLSRSAEFIERVCETGDPEAINVIWIKIFEWLLPRPEKLKLLWPVLGEKTKAEIEDAASRWNYPLAYLRDSLPTSN
jgi:hypothetical protein